MSVSDVASTQIPDWSKRVLTEKDFFEFCAAREIIFCETDLVEGFGEYRVHQERNFIILHKYAIKNWRLWILYHELGHYLLHYPSTAGFSDSTTRKMDWEANTVAAVALIPLQLLKQKTFFEIHDEYNYPKQLIKLRVEIYQRLGI